MKGAFPERYVMEDMIRVLTLIILWLQLMVAVLELIRWDFREGVKLTFPPDHIKMVAEFEIQHNITT